METTTAETAGGEATPAGLAPEQLKSIVERIENLEEEKAAIGEDIKQVYAEAKGNGFDTKALKLVIARRKIERAEREEMEAIVDLYENALGQEAGS